MRGSFPSTGHRRIDQFVVIRGITKKCIKIRISPPVPRRMSLLVSVILAYIRTHEDQRQNLATRETTVGVKKSPVLAFRMRALE